MKIRILAIIGAIAILLALGTGALAQTPAVAEIEGKVTAVDTAGKKVTITPESGAAITLNVTDTTEIEVPGKEPATLADIKVGQQVKAKYETATSNALEIKVRGVKAGKVQGEITALDAATKKATITPKQGEAITLIITAMTEIKVWGKEPAAFSDLKVGDPVKAEYNPSTKEALEIEVKAKGEASLAVRQGFFGTVKAKTNTSLTLTTKQGEVTLTLDANTQVWNPPQKDATLADIKVGDRVAVLAAKQGSTLLARRVLVIPPKPVRTQVTGTVTKIEGNTITVTDKEGNTFTVELPKGLAEKVVVGDVITVTLQRTPGVGKYLAGGMMRGEEMKERLHNFMEKIRDKKADTGEEKQRQAKDMDKLEGLMQRNMDRQQEILQKVKEKAPLQAREALEKARERSMRSWEQAREALTKAKGKPTATSTAR